jgi:hypothetical protein
MVERLEGWKVAGFYLPIFQLATLNNRRRRHDNDEFK